MVKKASYQVNNLVKDRLEKQILPKHVLMDNIKLIKENWSIIILYFYLVGFIYLKTYYGNFDIKIEYYLTLNDIVFIGLYKIIFIVFLYLFVELVRALLMGLFNFFSKKISYLRVDTLLYKRINFAYSASVGILLVIFMLMVVSYYQVSEKIFFIAMLTPYIFYKVISDIGLKKLKSYNFFLLSTMLAIIIFSYLSAISDSNGVKGDAYNPNLSIYTHQKTLKINGIDNTLIGETSSTMFIYNKSKRTSTVYSKSDFEKMEYGNDNIAC